MTRLIALLLVLSLTGCGAMVPAKGKMPAFGVAFDADIHAVAPPDEAKIIIYRNPDLDERLKFSITVNPWAYFAGYVFPGAFLETTRPPGTLTVISRRVWWDEDVPVGQSFLWKIEPGDPPPVPEGRIRHIIPKLEIEALPGTFTYLRIDRTITEEFVVCAESAETIAMCAYTIIEIKLEIVPPAEAQRELAGLRQTVYGKTEQ